MAKKIKLVAEFCQNHNGDFELLRHMIDAAAEGGATHAKIQSMFADDLSYRERFEEGKIDSDGQIEVIKRPYQSEYDRLKGLELTYEEHRRFVDACRDVGLEPLTTAFTLTCIPHIKELGWRAVKIASYDCGSLPLVEALAVAFEELIVSTGASYDEEVEAAARALQMSGVEYSLLHCVTIYPTPLSNMNLARMQWLMRLSDSVGLSDHSLVSRDGVNSAYAAIYLGADTVERHFTILPADQTRDGKVSITKDHLKKLCEFAELSREEQRDFLNQHVGGLDEMIGDETRTLSREELLNRDYYRGRFANKVDGKQIFNWEQEARDLYECA